MAVYVPGTMFTSTTMWVNSLLTAPEHSNPPTSRRAKCDYASDMAMNEFFPGDMAKKIRALFTLVLAWRQNRQLHPFDMLLIGIFYYYCIIWQRNWLSSQDGSKFYLPIAVRIPQNRMNGLRQLNSVPPVWRLLLRPIAFILVSSSAHWPTGITSTMSVCCPVFRV